MPFPFFFMVDGANLHILFLNDCILYTASYYDEMKGSV